MKVNRSSCATLKRMKLNLWKNFTSLKVYKTKKYFLKQVYLCSWFARSLVVLVAKLKRYIACFVFLRENNKDVPRYWTSGMEWRF